MTDTTTPALELEQGSLTLVRVSDDYLGSEEAWATAFLAARDLTGEEREQALTFYAVPSRDMGEGWATLIVPDSDPRAARGEMWGISNDSAHYAPLGLEGPHRGWNIRRRYLEPVRNLLTLEQALEQVRPSVVASPRPGNVLEVGDRVRLVVDAGDGSSHARIGDLGTVTDAGPGPWSLTTVRMDDGHTTRRDANRFERVEEASHGPVEGPVEEGRTYTAEDLEQAVREAREAALLEGREALEAWKEEANRIAVEYAKNNDLCGNFERAMEDIGLLGREDWDRAHSESYTVTFRVDVEVPYGSSDDDARYEAANLLAGMYGSSIVDYAVEVQDGDGDTVWSA